MKPLELYEFQTASTTYRYTSGDEAVTIGLGTFTPTLIGRGDSSASHEDGQNSLSIEVARTNPVAALHVDLPPDQPVKVTLYRLERGATTATRWWVGFVAGVRWDGSVAVLECDTILRAADRPGPRQRFQQPCRWALYSRGCGVDPESFKDTGTINAINQPIRLVQVLLPVQRDVRWFNGGWLQVGNRRVLIASSGGGFAVGGSFAHTLTVAYWAGELVLDSEVDVFAGCGHQRIDCLSKFNNVANYGGFAHLPKADPYEQRMT
jgi:uncharacterized phage protein (TIGR02218 family)